MRAHCMSSATTTYDAAPKNDIMLFVAVLRTGESRKPQLVSDASFRLSVKLTCVMGGCPWGVTMAWALSAFGVAVMLQ